MNKRLQEHSTRRVAQLRWLFAALATAFTLLYLSLTALAEARPAMLVKDIYPGDSSEPRSFAVLGDELYFVALDPDHGAEVWKSDGTEAGTQLVRDIAPQPGEQLIPGELTVFDGLVYFRGNNAVDGEELWVTDGTVTGTVMVKDINPGQENSFPSAFRALGDILFFAATDGVNGRELWKTDGTDTGTVMVKDINDIAGASSNPRIMTVVGDTLFFVADDGENGDELWKSDGTEGGTMMVSDIAPNAASSSPQELVDFGGLLLFTADNGVHGPELWRSNGTEAGTYMIKDVYPGPPDDIGNHPARLTVFGSHVYFRADNGTDGIELWKSDGTETGTVMASDIASGSESSLANFLTAGDSYLYFVATDNVHGRELWRTDGTDAGTVLVKDINPAGASNIQDVVFYNGALYFSADDGTNGGELWRSTGQASTTILFSDVHPAGDSWPALITGLGTTLFFVADDGDSGRELWSVTLTNDAPTADAGGPYNGSEGAAITLDAAAQDPDGDTLQYGWTANSPLCAFANGAQLQTSVTCADDGSFEVTLTVTDPFGVTDASTAAVTVDNVAPQIQDIDDALSVGENVVLDVSFTDAGSADTHTYEVDWGDGETTSEQLTPGATQFLVSHVYRAGGAFEISVVLSDDDGGSDSATLPVTVQFVVHLPALFKP